MCDGSGNFSMGVMAAAAVVNVSLYEEYSCVYCGADSKSGVVVFDSVVLTREKEGEYQTGPFGRRTKPCAECA
jgi:hypothetical protein